MLNHVVNFGPYKTSKGEDRHFFLALENARERLGDAKRELLTEGELDRMHLDAEHPQQLEQMIHEAMQDYAQDIAHYAGPSERDGCEGVSNDDIYYAAMDLLSEQVQKWADDNDFDLSFA